jgi:hypothetical protein
MKLPPHDNTCLVVLPFPTNIQKCVDWMHFNNMKFAYSGTTHDGHCMFWIKDEGDATMTKLVWG